MSHLNRRQFLATGGAGALATGAAGLAPGLGADLKEEDYIVDEVVKFFGDGLSLSPLEMSRLLAKLCGGEGVEADYYSLGGAVEQMEIAFAQRLGKPRAIFFPTGTLANHMALRLHAADPQTSRRVIVQKLSHVYSDSGDCAQLLSSLHLVPLARDEATFTLEQVLDEVRRTGIGRVRTAVGAISIETPVRRKLGERFDFEQMKQISAYAREQGIRMHLDGARLFLESAYSGVDVRGYAELFDTVYISVWKYFNAPFGAVLAGPAEQVEGLYHARRMFGGGLPAAWMSAALAYYFLDGFGQRFAEAVDRSEDLIAALAADGRFEIERIENGTGRFLLSLAGGRDHERFRSALRERGVWLGQPAPWLDNAFIMQVNETLNRASVEELIVKFRQAAA